MLNPQQPLAGRRILVTRPLHQCPELCARIERAGGQALIFPVIAIEPVQPCPDLQRWLPRLNEVGLAVFVSANAVAHALPALLQQGLPDSLVCAAVGKATAQALRKHGIEPLCPLQRFESEGLLALRALQAERVNGRQVLIFRGEGGRPLLGDTLRQRGARVDYVAVYRRSVPHFEPAAHPWIADGEIDAVLLSSSEGLQNLFKMLQSAHWLRQRPLILITERMPAIARSLGAEGPLLVAAEASNAGLFAALYNYFISLD